MSLPLGVMGFSGRARTGKDSLCAHYCSMDRRIVRYAFADELKKVYCEMAFITLEELEQNKEFHRQGLIDLAELELKVGNPGYFGTRFVEKVLGGDFAGKLVIITDFRYPAETEAVHWYCRDEKIPFQLIRVHRPSVARIKCGWQLEGYKHDGVYINRDRFSIDTNPDTSWVWRHHFCPMLFKRKAEICKKI